MIHRIRMARKRLGIARERAWSAGGKTDGAQALHKDFWTIVRLVNKEVRRADELRAIERLKELIA